MRLPRQAGRELRDIAFSDNPTHVHLRERLAIILGATVVVDVLASFAIYLFERDEHGTRIHTFGDSVFWTSAQLLTVSSQLPNPFSTGARILDIFLELWAVVFVAALAGSLGAFFHRRGMERHPLRPGPPTRPVS